MAGTAWLRMQASPEPQYPRRRGPQPLFLSLVFAPAHLHIPQFPISWYLLYHLQRYHLVPGTPVFSGDLADGEKLVTADNGKELTVRDAPPAMHHRQFTALRLRARWAPAASPSTRCPHPAPVPASCPQGAGPVPAGGTPATACRACGAAAPLFPSLNHAPPSHAPAGCV